MYSKKKINVFALVISIIIFLIVNYCVKIIQLSSYKEDLNNMQYAETDEVKTKEVNLKNEETNENNATNWTLEIPVISLKAEICEGTTVQVLNEYIGHFTETQKENGNIGLAAHNRGYPVNYFANLKELKNGDEIIYTYGENVKIYKVVQNIQISDIDWSYLENTEENRLTLITCIEDKPEYRRCVQAIEKE